MCPGSETAEAAEPVTGEDTGEDAVDVVRQLMRRSALVLVAVVIAAGLALALAGEVGDEGVDFAGIGLPALAGAIAIYLVLQTALMVVWQRILHRLDGGFGAQPERTAWAVSQLGKYVPTGAMLFVTRVLLASRAGGSRRAALNSSLYEFGCSFLAALAIASAAVGSMPELADSAFRFVVYFAPGPLLVVLHPAIFRPVANIALRRAGRDELEHALPLREVLAIAAAYAVVLAVGGLAILVLTTGLVEIDDGDAWLVVAAFSVGYVASVFGFLLPGGLGVRESGMALALSTIVPVGTAVTVVVVSRLVQIGVECFMAGAMALISRRRW